VFKLTFLQAAMHLTKTITATAGGIVKSGYPNMKNFTSTEVEVSSLVEFYKAVREQAALPTKPCLLKNGLRQPLVKQPRKGEMPRDALTHWVCLDLDRAPFSTPDEFMRAIGLGNVSYVAQYSSSYKVGDNKKMSCHIFCLLSKPMFPGDLKSWLTGLNLNLPVLEQALTLTDSRNAIRWTLDIGTCSNDTLIYIAPPDFVGMKDPVKPSERIQYVKHAKDTIDVTKLELIPVATLKRKTQDKRDAMRVAAGFPPIKHKLKIVGEHTIQPGADEADRYEIVSEDDEHVRLNLNNGDSNGYWFFKHDFKLLRNFKEEPFYPMQDILPELYKQMCKQAAHVGTTTINDSTGEVLLAFREKRTSKYYAGSYLPTEQKLELNMVDNKDMLTDFLMEHQVPAPPYIPTWEMYFDPQDDNVVNEDTHTINTFVLPPLMRAGKKTNYPLIQKVLDHAVGTGPVQEHFLNWLAVVLQHRVKTKTAWILHGTEGTGKGVIMNNVLKPIMQQYLVMTRVDELISEFNGWTERALIAFIDEIEVDALEQGKPTEGKIRNLITEPTLSIRRMRTNAYNAPNYTNLILSSNKNHPMRIPPGDRRFNVAQFQPVRFRTTVHEIEVELPKEVPGFAHYLLTRKADINLAAQIIETEDRNLIKQLSITSVDHIATAINNGDLEVLLEYLPDENTRDPVAEMYGALMKTFLVQKQNKITRDQLRIIFEHTIGKVPEGANKFTRFLAHHGLITKRIRIDNIAHYGVSTDWKFSNETYHEMSARFKLPVNVRRVK
jgi:hypothetical protein